MTVRFESRKEIRLMRRSPSRVHNVDGSDAISRFPLGNLDVSCGSYGKLALELMY